MNETINIIKQIAVEKLINTAEEIKAVPGIYKNTPYTRTQTILYDNEEYGHMAVSQSHGLVFLNEKAMKFPHYEIGFEEVENFKEIMKNGMKLDNIRHLQEGLEKILESINTEVEKETLACKAYLEEGGLEELVED